MAIAQIDFISAGQAYHVCTAMPLCPKVLLVTDALERRKLWLHQGFLGLFSVAERITDLIVKATVFTARTLVVMGKEFLENNNK